MREDYSRTAEGMAMVRALEQTVPPAKRIIIDPFAKEFLLNRHYRRLAGSALLSRGALLLLKYWAPGGQEFLTARARLVDDLAVKLAVEGLDQIVILGAGFDTMALRIRDALRGTTVFEVDHPATQITKREVMDRIGAPENLRFAAVDFEKDDFVRKLREAGFDPVRRSFVAWVGVSYYLTGKAVANTLEQIAGLGGAGTKLVWDYLLAEVINGTTTNRDALDKARRAAKLGEPWLFGLETSQLPYYVEQFGFHLLKDYNPEELREMYCPRRSTPMSYVRIAVCERHA
jgi:methyltransferase (TIGR00027 family)